MYFVYAIRSLKENWVYIGMTDNVSNRLDEHNYGNVKSTKARRPFEIVFVQIVQNRAQARNLEKYLKVGWNKESLLELIKQ